MRITKKQLRRIIREAVRDLVPSDPTRPWGSYSEVDADTYSDVIVMSPNGDSVLVDGQETYIQDVPSQLEYASGFEMSDVDADNLIFALENQQQDGYVELGVSYENGQWGW
tara:strand:- start:1998 stop:2330 length:333 start_codon:yes stop_codon:yes gene_type:complete